MDIGRALTFMTEDERWLEKLGIGTAVILFGSFILIGPLLAMGYAMRLLENVRRGDEHPLPEWDRWGDDLARGFKLFIAQIVWALPIILLTVPVIIGGIMTDAGGDANEIIGGLLIGCSFCLILVYALFVSLAIPGITIAVAKNDDIASGLRVTEIFHWTRNNIGQVIIVALVIWAGQMIIGTVASIAGVLLCGIGLLVTLPLATLVSLLFQYHLFGQLAHDVPLGEQAQSGANVSTI